MVGRYRRAHPIEGLDFPRGFCGLMVSRDLGAVLRAWAIRQITADELIEVLHRG